MTSDPPHPPADSKPTKSLGKQILFVILILLILLALLEGVASLLPLDQPEPGRINQAAEVFIPGEGDQAKSFVNSPAFANYMQPQQFSLHKAPGVKRIFILGGSAALGWPGEEACSFSGFLRTALEQLYPGEFEVVNAAIMSFGSHRVLNLLTDVIKFEPDLVIIWSGNNEYVESNLQIQASNTPTRKRLNRLLSHSNLFRAVRSGLLKLAPSLLSREDERDITNPRVARGSLGRLPETDLAVLNNYRSNLAAMAELLADQQIKALFSTVPSNLSDWAPDGTRPGFETLQASHHWEKLLREGIAHLDAGAGGKAAQLFQQAQTISPEYALGAYFFGLALQSSGEFAEAYRQFELARDLDPNVLRAIGPFNTEIQRTSARFTSGEHIDLSSAFRKASGQQLVGLDLFYDYCHPNQSGHKLAAETALPKVLAIFDKPVKTDQLSRLKEFQTCPPQDKRHQASIAYALGLTYANNGKQSLAEQQYREALKLRADFPEALSNLSLLLMKRGDLIAAEPLLVNALEADPMNIGALYQLGSIRFEQGRLIEANELVRQALKLNASFAEAQETLGDIASRMGQLDEAEQAYRLALASGGENFYLHLKLGDLLRARGASQQAVEHWELARQIEPDHPEIQRRLR